MGILQELVPAMTDVPYGINVPGIPPMNQKVLYLRESANSAEGRTVDMKELELTSRS